MLAAKILKRHRVDETDAMGLTGDEMIIFNVHQPYRQQQQQQQQHLYRVQMQQR
jgi:hypothetical protein